MNVLRGRAATRSVTIDADESPVDADGAVTVTVTRSDGTELLSATADKPPATIGHYRYALPPQADLDRLTETWTATLAGQPLTITTETEVVGGYYVPLSELRAVPNLPTAKYSTHDLREARDWFEAIFEDETGVAWVPRFARETVAVRGKASLVLDHYPVRRILAVSVEASPGTTTAYTSGEIADLDMSRAGSGVISRRTGWFGPGLVTVAYEHGHTAPLPDIRRACIVGVREGLLTNKVGARQFSVATEEGIVREALASEKYPFGVPFCDAVVNRHRRRRSPVVA